MLVAGIRVVVTDIIKPRLNVSEVRHRLAPSEGQKEIARRSKPCRKHKNGRNNKMTKHVRKHCLLSMVLFSLLLISCLYSSLLLEEIVDS